MNRRERIRLERRREARARNITLAAVNVITAAALFKAGEPLIAGALVSLAMLSLCRK